MKTVCSHCSQDYDVPDEHVGKNGKCAACGKTFTMKEYFACPKCHSFSTENIQPCTKCGYSLENEKKGSAITKLWKNLSGAIRRKNGKK